MKIVLRGADGGTDSLAKGICVDRTHDLVPIFENTWKVLARYSLLY